MWRNSGDSNINVSNGCVQQESTETVSAIDVICVLMQSFGSGLLYREVCNRCSQVCGLTQLVCSVKD